MLSSQYLPISSCLQRRINNNEKESNWFWLCPQQTDPDPDADYDDFMMDEREAMDDYTFNGDGKVYMDRELREMDNGKYLRK